MLPATYFIGPSTTFVPPDICISLTNDPDFDRDNPDVAVCPAVLLPPPFPAILVASVDNRILCSHSDYEPCNQGVNNATSIAIQALSQVSSSRYHMVPTFSFNVTSQTPSHIP